MTNTDALQKSIKKNLPLKILALILALTLWFHISRTGREFFSVTVPVNVIKLPPRLELERSHPNHVTLTLEGPPGFGQRLNTESLSIILDGQNLTPGQRTIRLTSRTLTLPTGVSVVRFAPKNLTLTLLPLQRKTVRILPQFIGETHHRITPLRVHIVPEQATIEGDKNELATVHFLKTNPIELSKLAKRKFQSFEIPITIPDTSRIRLITPAMVKVEISPSGHSSPRRSD